MEWVRRILCAIIWTAQGPVLALCLEKMLPINRSFSRKVRLAIWTISIGIFSCLHAFFHPGPIQVVSAAMLMISPLFLLYFLYQGRFLLRLGAFVSLFLIPECLDILLSPPWCALLGTTPAEYYARMGPDFVFMAATIQLIAFALQGVVCNIWCRRRKGLRELRSSVLMLGIALVGLCIMTSILLTPSSSTDALSGTSMAVSTCLACLLIGTVFVLLSWAEKDTLRKNLDESRRVMELERAHYASVEARRTEIGNIRSDYNQVLTSVLELLGQGAIDQAQEVLSRLSDRVAATKEAPFCSIPIINAVLTEKQALCRNQGITLQTDFLLPDNLPIRDLDLCSAFSNLLDNAVRACTQEAAPIISLSCRVIQGYLVIKCVNPSPRVPGPKPEHTGYGLKILQEMAQRYHGHFHTDYHNHIFIAQLSLLAKPEGGSTI